ncbi:MULTISPECIES: potassium channel family protein [unclassified Nocardioides]|uniref:potassium channel family protein n=1 Tax=unclassified Nocardioides TaxID=2615069 RepID=UPI0009EFD590|nr:MULTISPECIES: potassium channel protein [unclassified Nocardioides]GAW48543.1 Potassium channel [Nocardioides sp. PD653-B2]GAW52870.1 Potassium channel [Nocardioides sp. PD653]
MNSVRRIGLALTALAVVTVFGTIGYLCLGFTFLEELYQTVTTVATVGFREVRPLGPAGQVFTMVLIVVGVGTVLYNLGVILEAVTEGHLRLQLERRRMDAHIAALRGHVIICGYGRVGRAAADFLLLSGEQVVLVDNDPTRFDELDPATPRLVGDVNDDRTLVAAGIEHARAVIVSLESDADTVYTTLSARALRPDVVIMARARTTGSKSKLELAGATRAVNPQRSGGRRLAAFALQPDVAEFLDVVMHEENLDWRVQQVLAAAGSELDGRRLGDLDLRTRTGALVLAVRRSPEAPFEPNPPDDLVVPAGALLIALGTQAELSLLSALAG